MDANKQKVTAAMTNLVGWVDRRLPFTSMVRAHLTEYYAPKNFNFGISLVRWQCWF